MPVTKTLWNRTSKHSKLYEELMLLREVNDVFKETKEAKNLVKATYLYYDLYNNGLCNDYIACCKFFGLENDYPQDDIDNIPFYPVQESNTDFYKAVENGMNKCVFQARKSAEKLGLSLLNSI